MIRIVANAACVAALAMAALVMSAPAHAQLPPTGVTVPGASGAQVNRAIPGTPGSPGTVVNPITGVQAASPRGSLPTPTYHNGLSSLTAPSLDAANRSNGVVGQAGVSGVRGVHGVRPVGSAPIGQGGGASRPVVTWQQ